MLANDLAGYYVPCRVGGLLLMLWSTCTLSSGELMEDDVLRLINRAINFVQFLIGKVSKEPFMCEERQ